MPDMASSQRDGAGQRESSGWHRTRFGVLLPLGIVVAVAFVCVVVAALMSAHRADIVALDPETVRVLATWVAGEADEAAQ